jgi:hypothetical protein
MSHFKYDKALVRRTTRRDLERELQDARRDGFYSYTTFQLVPIHTIVPEAVWNPPRIERIREALANKTPLPPIYGHFDQAGRFHISDGIHRYNASLEAGFTHVPALVSVTVEAPEMKEPELPERPKQQVGAAVLLREPKKLGAESPWAIIEQVLYKGQHRGVTRHHYALVGIRQGVAEFIGDYRDDQLDIPPEGTRPPKKVVDAFRAYDTLRGPDGTSPLFPQWRKRVASRYLAR